MSAPKHRRQRSISDAQSIVTNAGVPTPLAGMPPPRQKPPLQSYNSSPNCMKDVPPPLSGGRGAPRGRGRGRGRGALQKANSLKLAPPPPPPTVPARQQSASMLEGVANLPLPSGPAPSPPKKPPPSPDGTSPRLVQNATARAPSPLANHPLSPGKSSGSAVSPLRPNHSPNQSPTMSPRRGSGVARGGMVSPRRGSVSRGNPVSPRRGSGPPVSPRRGSVQRGGGQASPRKGSGPPISPRRESMNGPASLRNGSGAAAPALSPGQSQPPQVSPRQTTGVPSSPLSRRPIPVPPRSGTPTEEQLSAVRDKPMPVPPSEGANTALLSEENKRKTIAVGVAISNRSGSFRNSKGLPTPPTPPMRHSGVPAPQKRPDPKVVVRAQRRHNNRSMLSSLEVSPNVTRDRSASTVVDALVDMPVPTKRKKKKQSRPQKSETSSTQEGDSEEERKERHQRLRRKVILEFVDTEETYLGDLLLIVSKLLNPLRAGKSAQGIIGMDDQARLFSNIELLLDFVKDLYKDLSSLKSDDTSVMIGDVLNTRLDYLVQVYSHYCLNQSTANSTFDKLMAKNKSFKTFVETQQNHPDCRGLDLMAYLVKPVQRLCKYPLLFRELIKYTPEDHPDYANLVKALTNINSVVTSVNENTKQERNVKSILEITESLEGAKHIKLIAPGRTFINSERFTKISGKNIQERQFFLFSDLLLYASPNVVKKSKKQIYQFKGLIPLKMCFVKDLPDTESRRNAIEIWRIDLKKKYIIYHQNPEKKKEWLKQIDECQQALTEADDDEAVEVDQAVTVAKASAEGEGDKSFSSAFMLSADGPSSNSSVQMAMLENRIQGIKDFIKDRKDRKLVMEGLVNVEEDGKYKERLFVMFEDAIVVAKRHADRAKKGMHMKMAISLQNIMVMDLTDTQDRKNAFEIVQSLPKTLHVKVACPSPETKDQWLKALYSAVERSLEDAIAQPAQMQSISSEDTPTSPLRVQSLSATQGLTQEELAALSPEELMERLSKSGMVEDTSQRKGPAKVSSAADIKSSKEKLICCPRCLEKFTLKRTKRGCQVCNKTFCSVCCSKKKKLTNGSTVRVCDRCFLKG